VKFKLQTLYTLKTKKKLYTNEVYGVFREQADWTFILPSELPTKELRPLPRKMPPKDY
jgi:hypothetical protein